MSRLGLGVGVITPMITKAQLFELAASHGVVVSKRSNKTQIENALKAQGINVEKKTTDYMVGRNGTLYNEIGKMLQDRVDQFPVSEYPEWLSKALDDQHKSRRCIYCDKMISSAKINKKKGDHYFSVISDKCPRQPHNFSKFKVTCCSTCNSAKGSMKTQQFLEKKGYLTPAKRSFFQRLEDFIETNIQYSYYDNKEYENLKTEIKETLEGWSRRVRNMQITSYQSDLPCMSADLEE
jgi:hypothetical protein